VNVAKWRNLQRDEPIGVVALSGPVDPGKLESGLRVLRGWGNPVELAPNLLEQHGYLAGPDAERLAGLDELLERGVRTFIAARGGFGLSRLLDRLPWERLAAARARFVGYSDLTALLGFLRGAGQVHGPMVAAGLARGSNGDRLRALLRGGYVGKPLFSFHDSQVLRHGTGCGVALGGNLSLMTAMMGTPWEANVSGSVLFLEEVGEPGYRLDRMLTQLAHCRGFDGIAGVVTGRLHGCRPSRQCRRVWRERLLEVVPEQVPVVTGLPFGHGADNRAFPIGVEVVVDSSRGEVIWRA
jgi:muramoyltetrapeptide carboxypeptidase